MEKAVTIGINHELEQIQDADVRAYLAYVCEHLAAGQKGRKPSKAIKAGEDLCKFVHFAKAVFYYATKLSAILHVSGFERDVILASSFLHCLSRSAEVDIAAVSAKYPVDTVAGKRAVKQVSERLLWEGCEGGRVIAELGPWEKIITLSTLLVAPQHLFSVLERKAVATQKFKAAA